ncbi:MAG: polymerase III, alpha subunit protein [Candidatus Roizmanbacteria bacterium GW2011_GWA2_37_7]|uniref:Polymerase III, alpha subunit protein n=1 Tax=Candidatus Roizmanbacteria bacterium GW2011_GWA2_37_7 TaxID=1618481 RepID=A0A0G0H2E1_9BACT|nr:MAG: polymerase III, alpha subunit protein [Candidatus Roizmanbacteria bacterium GW2011_GWA2_37_7]
MSEISKAKEKKAEGQFGLFGQHDQKRYEKDTFTQLPEYPDDKLIEFEKDVIGFLISRNPMEKHKDIIKKKINKHICDITHADVDKMFIFAGNISSKKLVKTKRNNSEMAFLQINDITGTIELIVFPKIFVQVKDECETNSVILFQAKVSERDGDLSLILNKLVNLDNRAKQVHSADAS